MAAEASLLPMDISTLLDQDTAPGVDQGLQSDPFLQELFTNNEGVSTSASLWGSEDMVCVCVRVWSMHPWGG